MCSAGDARADDATAATSRFGRRRSRPGSPAAGRLGDDHPPVFTTPGAAAITASISAARLAGNFTWKSVRPGTQNPVRAAPHEVTGPAQALT